MVSGMSAKDLKIPALPLLARQPLGLPYTKWSKSVKIKLGAVGAGATISDSWTPSTPEEVQWWNIVNPLVYAALYDAVQKNDTLSDNIARYFENDGAGRLAWNAIKAFYVRVAEGNSETLMLKLNALAPGEKESMESFLCRCNNLREEYQQYNLSLDDSLLISHVFGQLDTTWRWMSDMSNTPTNILAWDGVADALQKQDNQRRQGQKQNPLILPLGWVSRELYQKPKVAAAHAAQGAPQDSNQGAAANAAQGGYKGKNTRYNTGPPAGQKWTAASGIPGQKAGSFFICFCCFEFGHGCNECPKRSPGWKITPEIKAKATALRDAKLEKFGRPKSTPGEQPQYGKAAMAQGEQSPHVL